MSEAPHQRNVLIQGASRGLGLAMVEELLARPDVARVFATCRDPEASDALRRLHERHRERLALVRLDVRDEPGVGRAALQVEAAVGRLHLLINAAGVLHTPDGIAPEKRLEAVESESLRQVFEVNAFGPLLVAKAFLPLLRHDERSVLANVSARVGSIGDNRSGGWYAYRASKAAQNMFTRTLAIELRRRAPSCICVALHPGTVDTALSEPFQRGVPAERLFAPEFAAHQLLEVAEGLTPDSSGRFLAWDGSEIPW